jgi:hypothetical protein
MKIRFTAIIKRFDNKGEKTGWTYIEVPCKLAEQIHPADKKSFRVKGKLDQYSFSGTNLIPMGGGDYILAINAAMRKGIKKQKGAEVEVQMEKDKTELKPPEELMESLQDEPKALERFNSMPRSHQNYFTNWINSARTIPTKAKRIAAAINALERGWDFGQMLRAMRKDKID